MCKPVRIGGLSRRIERQSGRWPVDLLWRRGSRQYRVDAGEAPAGHAEERAATKKLDPLGEAYAPYVHNPADCTQARRRDGIPGRGLCFRRAVSGSSEVCLHTPCRHFASGCQRDSHRASLHDSMWTEKREVRMDVTGEVLKAIG